ncbi:Lrp/AsnC family transcriptional regulator [Thermomonas sp.]|uniref:Lrp/AsnC family transcriptional regulator n=1 Tax=Thermomonas sp. TaxID=1971895 RepID=UPI002D006F1F|nr:Lrp/AsnC family transcriptional regulator [Thermomonas sp.]HRO62693.1 Lrp/AsnC family transcriptional regulator [Thermomonas sp.]
MSAAVLDRIDLQLLALLQREGRHTNAELAEKVHLSASACLRRVQRLGLGLQAFVRVQLKSHDAARVEAFARQVNRWPEVVACHALTGDMDYLLHVVVSGLEHFSHFLLDHLLAQGDVGDVNSSFVLRTVKQARALGLPSA